MNAFTLIRRLLPRSVGAFFVGTAYLFGGSAGWWAATSLASIPNLQLFKVLNIIGIGSDLLGVLLLSRLVVTNLRYQRFVVEEFSDWMFHFLFGLVWAPCILASYLDGPSARLVGIIWWTSGPILVVPLLIMIMRLFGTSENFLNLTVEQRASLLGGYFVFSGLLVQLFAAVLDLNS